MHDLGASNVCDRRSFVARERRWSHRPLSLCRVCLSSQISILARCEIQIFEAERLAFVCDSVNYVLTSSVQFSPSSNLRRSSHPPPPAAGAASGAAVLRSTVDDAPCRVMVMVGKTMALGALLAVEAVPSGANAQVPVPNARQLDFMELELTQFM